MWSEKAGALLRRECGNIGHTKQGRPAYAFPPEAFMKSKLKWIGIAFVVLIVILFVLPFFIPVNRFKPTIEQKASEALGRKVQVGNLSLSILGGSLGIADLSISDDLKFNPGPFLTAKKVKVGVDLIPLIFSQQLNVNEVTIVGPQVMMLKDPSAKWNFSSIGGSSPQKAKTPPAGGGGIPPGAVS